MNKIIQLTNYNSSGTFVRTEKLWNGTCYGELKETKTDERGQARTEERNYLPLIRIWSCKCVLLCAFFLSDLNGYSSPERHQEQGVHCSSVMGDFFDEISRHGFTGVFANQATFTFIQNKI